MFVGEKMVPLPLLLSLLRLMKPSVMGQQTIVHVDHALTWKDAQTYCREHHTDLLTIRTEEDNNQLNENTWLGLHRVNSTAPFKWSIGDKPLTFSNTWESGSEPRSGRDCVLKLKKDSGPWRSVNCTQTRRFFCLDIGLFLVNEKKTWEEALAHCRSLTTSNYRCELASIITAEDHDYVRSRISGEVWTGLRFLGGLWVWVGGDTVDFSALSASCPSIKRCGMLKTTITEDYSITECDQRKEFFCRKHKIK